MQDDKDLIELLLNSKTQNEGFKKLVQLYQKPLYCHIRNIVLNHDDTDDVLQNTFIKVFTNISKFKGESKLYSWIYRIATNESLTFLQQKAKKSGISNEEVQLIGLGARDTLRLEAGLCLMGNDMNEDLSPIESNLDFTIGKRRKEESNFLGSEIIMKHIKEGVQKKNLQ